MRRARPVPELPGVRERKVLLVNTASGVLGTATAGLLGATLLDLSGKRGSTAWECWRRGPTGGRSRCSWTAPPWHRIGASLT